MLQNQFLGFVKQEIGFSELLPWENIFNLSSTITMFTKYFLHKFSQNNTMPIDLYIDPYF